jgi:hypothetical protein
MSRQMRNEVECIQRSLRLFLAVFLALSAGNPGLAQRVENLGPLVYSATQEKQLLFRDPRNGQTHLLMYYVTGPVWKVPYQILDVNLTTGTYRKVNGLLGRPGPNATVYHPNGRIYTASGDPGFFMEYNPSNGQTRIIQALADKGCQWIEIGDDGALYLGETIKGIVERYDPATGAWTNYGIMDDPGPPYYRYAYTLGADQRYIYVGMGQNPWYLVVYDRQTGTQQTFWKNLNSACVMVYKGVSGGWFAQVSGMGWFKLENGQPVSVQGTPNVYAWYLHGNIGSDLPSCQARYGYEFDLSDAIPVSAAPVPWPARIRWRPIGATAWRGVSPILRTTPQALKQLYVGPDGKLFGFAAFYGPLFRYDLALRRTIILGNDYRSNYDAVYHAAKRLWFIIGYAAATIRYDPARPWTLSGSVNGFDPRYNPFYLSGAGKYHYYAAIGKDNYVYVGVHHERDSTGGELVWYDPDTNLKGSLRDPFINYDVADLKAVLDGGKIVYSSSALHPGDSGRLFVLNTATRALERAIIPVPGLQNLGKIVEVAPGIVMGVSGRKVYKVDITTGRVLFVVDLAADSFPNTSSYDRRLRLGPDGSVWLPVRSDGSGYLAKILPANGQLELVRQVGSVVNVLFIRHAGGRGYDALLYGDTNLRRISNLIP